MILCGTLCTLTIMPPEHHATPLGTRFRMWSSVEGSSSVAKNKQIAVFQCVHPLLSAHTHSVFSAFVCVVLKLGPTGEMGRH